MDAASKYEVTGRDDLDRLKFMYSPFPADRNVNPKHWESKVQFWSTEILKLSRFSGNICNNCEMLREKFRNADTKETPSGLMVVLSELYNTGQILLMSDFSYLLDNSWREWSYNVFHKSTSWLWRKVLYGGLNEQTKFVMKELLEEYALALLDVHYKAVKYEKTDNVVPWNVIKTMYKINGRSITEDDLICIIGHLKNKGKCKVAIFETGDKVVKFKQKSQDVVDIVSDSDFEVLKLKKAIARLTIECKQVDKECERLQTQAQIHVKDKERDKAKRVLAEKKRVTKTATLKHDALFSMKEHLCTVQEAETTKMITNAFNSSATLLNQSYKGQGLSVEHVDDVIEKTMEANEMVNEVEEALSTGLKHLEGEYDMDELEKELAELEVEGKAGSKVYDVVPDLPDIPTDNLPSTKETISQKRKKEMLSAM